MRLLFSFQHLKRLAALGLVVCLTGEHCIAAPLQPAASAASRTPVSADFLASLPSETAVVSEVWTGSSSGPFFLLIQDPHGHPEGQIKIEDLLHRLHGTPGLGALYLEGAIGSLDASALKFFDSPELNRRAADFLTAEGEIGGAERFLLALHAPENGATPFAEGVEDEALYLESLHLFREIMESLPDSAEILERKRAELLKNTSERLDANAASFLKALMMVEVSSSDYLGIARLLIKESAQRLSFDWEDPSLQIEFPMLIRLAELFRRTPLEDKNRSEEESRKLRDWLETNGSSHAVPFFAETSPAGKAGHRNAWERFYEETVSLGLTLKDYPHLSLSEGSRILEAELDGALLSEEMDRLRGRLFASIAGEPNSHEVLQAYESFRLLAALLNLHLTRVQYEALRKDSAFSSGGQSGIVKKALRFYELAVLRDAALIKNAEAHAAARGVRYAAVVAGGFHTQGFREALKVKNISYAVLTPRMALLENASTYIRSITGRTIAGRYHLRNPTWAGRWGPEIGADLQYRRKSLERQIRAQWSPETSGKAEPRARSEMRAGKQEEEELPPFWQVAVSTALAAGAVGSLFYLGDLHSERVLNEGGTTTLGDLFNWAGMILGTLKALVLTYALPSYLRQYVWNTILPDHRQREKAALDALQFARGRLQTPRELTEATLDSIISQARERFARKMKPAPARRALLFFTSSWAEKRLQSFFDKELAALETDARKKVKSEAPEPPASIQPPAAETAVSAVEPSEEVKSAPRDRKQKKRDKREKRRAERISSAETPVSAAQESEENVQTGEEEAPVSVSPEEVKRRALEMFRGFAENRLVLFERLLQKAVDSEEVRALLTQYHAALQDDRRSALNEAGASAENFEEDFTAVENELHFKEIFPDLPAAEAIEARIRSLEEAERTDYGGRIDKLLAGLEGRLGSFSSPEEVPAAPEAETLKREINSAVSEEILRNTYLKGLERGLTRLSYRAWEARDAREGALIDTEKRSSRRFREILERLGAAKNAPNLEESVLEYTELHENISADPAVPFRLKSRTALGLAHALAGLKRFDEALTVLEGALRHDPYNLYLRTQKAYTHLQASEKAATNSEETTHLHQAVDETDHALTGHPENWPAAAAKLSALIDLAEDAEAARQLADEIERKELYGPNRGKFAALRSRMKRMGEPAIRAALRRLETGIRLQIENDEVFSEEAIRNHALIAEFRKIWNRPGVEKSIRFRYQGDLESSLRTLAEALRVRQERKAAEAERLRSAAAGALALKLDTLISILAEEAATGAFSVEDLSLHPEAAAYKQQIEAYSALDAAGAPVWLSKLEDVLSKALTNAAEVREQKKTEALKTLETDLESLRGAFNEALEGGRLAESKVSSHPLAVSLREAIEHFERQYVPQKAEAGETLKELIRETQERIRRAAVIERGLEKFIDSTITVYLAEPAKFKNPEDVGADSGLALLRGQIAEKAPNEMARQRLTRRLETGIASISYEVWGLRNERESGEIARLRTSSERIKGIIRSLGAANTLANQERNYERALERYTVILKDIVSDRSLPYTFKSQAFVGRAKMLHALGRPEEAALAFGEGLVIDPWNPYLRVQKADAHLYAAGAGTAEMRTRHLRDSLSEAGSVLAAQPNNWAAAQVVLEAMIRLAEDPEGAEALIRKVEETRMHDRERGKLDRLSQGVRGMREAGVLKTLAKVENEILEEIRAGTLTIPEELERHASLADFQKKLEAQKLETEVLGRILQKRAEAVQRLGAAIEEIRLERERAAKEKLEAEKSALREAALLRLETEFNQLQERLWFELFELKVSSEEIDEHAALQIFRASLEEAVQTLALDVSKLSERLRELADTLKVFADGLETEDEQTLQIAAAQHSAPLEFGRALLDKGRRQGAGIVFREALSVLGGDIASRLEMALEAAALDTDSENHTRAALILEEELLLLPADLSGREKELEKKVRIELARSFDRIAEGEREDAFRASFMRFRAAEILTRFPGFEDDVEMLAAFEDVTRTLRKVDEPEIMETRKRPLLERDRLVFDAAEALREAFAPGGAMHAYVLKLEAVTKSPKMDRKKRGEALRVLEEFRNALAPFAERLAGEFGLPPEGLPLLRQDAEAFLEDEVRRLFPIRAEYLTSSPDPRVKKTESLKRRWPLNGALNWTQLIYTEPLRGYLGPVDSEEILSAAAASTGVYMFYTAPNASGRREGLDVQLFYAPPPRQPAALSTPPDAPEDSGITPAEEEAAEDAAETLQERIRQIGDDPLYAIDYAAAYLSAAREEKKYPNADENYTAWLIEAAGDLLKAGAALVAEPSAYLAGQRAEYLWLFSQYEEEAGRPDQALNLALQAIEILDRETEGAETNSYSELWEAWILARSPEHPAVLSRRTVRNSEAGIEALLISRDMEQWKALNDRLSDAAARSEILLPKILEMKRQLFEMLLEWAEATKFRREIKEMIDARLSADSVLKNNEAFKQALFAMIDERFAKESAATLPEEKTGDGGSAEIIPTAVSSARKQVLPRMTTAAPVQKKAAMDTVEGRAVIDLAPEVELAARIFEDLTQREKTEQFTKGFSAAEREFYDEMLEFLDELGSSDLSGEMIPRNSHSEVWQGIMDLNALRTQLFTEKIHLDPNRNERFVYAYQLGFSITTIVLQKLKGPSYEKQFGNAIFGWAYHQLNHYDSSYRLAVRLKYYTGSSARQPSEAGRSEKEERSERAAPAAPEKPQRSEWLQVLDFSAEAVLAGRLLEDSLKREREEKISEQLSSEEISLYDKILDFLRDVKNAQAVDGKMKRGEYQKLIDTIETLKRLRDSGFSGIEREAYPGNQEFHRLHRLASALRRIFWQKLQGSRNSHYFSRERYSRAEEVLQTFDPGYEVPEIKTALEARSVQDQGLNRPPEPNLEEGGTGEIRSELRAIAAVEVANVMTAGILPPGSPYLEKLLFERRVRIERERISLEEKKRLAAELAALRPGSAALILPASLLLALDRPVREELVGLWAEGLAEAPSEEAPRFYFTGEGAEVLRRELFAYPVMRTRVKSGSSEIPFSSLLHVEKFERPVLDRLKKAAASISFWHEVPADRGAARIPALLVSKEDVLRLEGADKFRFVDRLVKVQWLLARAVSGLKAEELGEETLNLLTAELLRKMGAEFTLGPSGIVMPSPRSLLSETVTQYIASQAQILQSA